MNIILDAQVNKDLEYFTSYDRMEFSGLARLELKGETIHIVEYELLAVGSEVWTEIPAEEGSKPREGEWRVWFHRHPVGNGKPGPHNWSGTDQQTITTEPLGTIPELVGWSVSIVRTPLGWVGRIDNHITKQTKHLPVLIGETDYARIVIKKLKIEEAIASAEALKQRNKLASQVSKANAAIAQSRVYPFPKKAGFFKRMFTDRHATGPVVESKNWEAVYEDYKNQDQFAGARQQLGYGGGDEGWQPELFSRPSHDLGQDFGQEVGLSNAAYDTVERAELALMELEDMCNSCQDVGMCDECWVETRKNEMREVGKL